ncbi:DUF2383 domain-containing protein [Neotamlana laminarinivorans]|uniref:DUF2383 domain-containing protein n=1 Tax=Neotamlana laminarinivorans TaxID=2883124 RepID=A0A9X1HYM1_9FLAO|nr:DUF2383 domain-containing protein [Tamlana laminarinivorans]MCB4798533.1 DUF2383 domain-containing protein [Tamlana laminarinivorans]
MKNSPENVAYLNKLLTLNFNTEKAFINLSENIESESVSKFLRLISNDRAQFIKALDSAIRNEGGIPEYPQVSTPLMVGYGLNEILKSIKSSHDDVFTFTEIGKIQMIDIERYQAVINKLDLSDELEHTLKIQKENLVMTLYAINVYKDSCLRNKVAV